MKHTTIALLFSLTLAALAATAEETVGAAKTETGSTAPEEAKETDDTKVVIETNGIAFKKDDPSTPGPLTFTVKAGAKVAILYKLGAADSLQHNLVILKPDTDKAYETAVLKLITADIAKAMELIYLPDDATSKAAVVAASTKLIGLGVRNEVIRFTAPAEPGDYPVLCTFIGHSAVMRGVMKVEK